MTFQLQPEVPVFGGILLVIVSLLVYSIQQYFQRGRKPELFAFTVLLVAISLWQFTAIFIHTITIPALILAGINFGNAVVALLFSYSLAWFSLTYSGQTQWVNRWTAGFALATIAATSVMVIFNPEFMTEVTGLTTQGPVTIRGITFTEWVVPDRTLKPAFRVFLLYNYVITVLSGVILGRYLLENRGDIYTGQAIALGVGAGTPIAVSTLLFLGILSPKWNPTHIAFSITAVGFAVAIFRYQLFTVAPVGRRQLVEQLSDPVVILDEKNNIVDCNPAARELVDAPDGWRGMDAAAFFAPFSDPVNWFTTSRSGETMLSQSGTERSFILDSSPIKDRSGTPTGQLVQLTEITEQKARERQLEEQNEDLDEFASIISHDLQSPLNVAKARLKLAKRESDDEQLAEVDEALTRMESLIDTLLTKARYSRTTDDFEPISVERVAKTAWTYSDIDNCTLTTSISADVLIMANRDRLLALFQNLYENAGDHNEPPVNVRVGVIDDKTLATDDGEQTGFYIADDGNGLSIYDRNKLFEKGYTTSSSGTGLGLAIVQDIVTAHDWEIAVTESEDGGARFEITGVEFTDE